MSIAALVSFANLCTANNDRLIMAGPIAKDSGPFKIDPRRSASLLISSALALRTGIFPFGAQMLMAAGLGHALPYRDHAISLLPVSIKGRRLIGDLIQLSEEKYKYGKLNG